MEIEKGSNVIAPRTGSLSSLRKKDICGPTKDAVEWENPKQHIHPYLNRREYSLKHEAVCDEVPVCQLWQRSEVDIEPVGYMGAYLDTLWLACGSGRVTEVHRFT